MLLILGSAINLLVTAAIFKVQYVYASLLAQLQLRMTMNRDTLVNGLDILEDDHPMCGEEWKIVQNRHAETWATTSRDVLYFPEEETPYSSQATDPNW